MEKRCSLACKKGLRKYNVGIRFELRRRNNCCVVGNPETGDKTSFEEH